MEYLYGEEVEYKIDIIKPEDLEILQAFSCDNEQLDRYIHKEMISDGEVDTNDGLPFKFTDKIRFFKGFSLGTGPFFVV